MYSPDDFIVELNDNALHITCEKWREIFARVRKEKSYISKHDYGIKVSTDIIPELKGFPVPHKDHFWFLLTNGTSNSEFYIHFDGQPNDGSSCGINWPILNCDEKSTTIWVEPETEDYFEVSKNSFMLKEGVKTKEIYRYHLMNDQPVLFRSNLWHYAVNGTESRQWRVIVKLELLIDKWEVAKEWSRSVI